MVVYDGHGEGLMASARVWWMFRVSYLSLLLSSPNGLHSLCNLALLSFYVRSMQHMLREITSVVYCARPIMQTYIDVASTDMCVCVYKQELR